MSVLVGCAVLTAPSEARAADPGDGATRARGERVTLPPPGACATPRDRAQSPPAAPFYVSGSPESRIVPHAVSGIGRVARRPAPTPPTLGSFRAPCDGAGGPCVPATAPAIVEPPPVPTDPPGVPPKP